MTRRVMGHLQTTALVTSLAVVLAACGDDGGDTETGLPGDGGPSDSAADTAEQAGADELAGRTFVSVTVTEGDAERHLVEGTEIELNFPDDSPSVGWSAGCNQFGADLDIEGDVLVVAPPEGTLMGCDEERHTQDEWLAGFLTSEPTWSLEEDTLTLTGATGGTGADDTADADDGDDGDRESGADTTVIELVEREDDPDGGGGPDGPDGEAPEPDDSSAEHDAGSPPAGSAPGPAPALEGRTWVVTELIDGDTVSPVDPGVEATLTIEGGQLGLNACNTGGGQVHEITGDEIEVDPPITTMMACGPPLDDVERAMVAVLDGRINYTVDGDRLALTHPGGHGLVLTAQG